MRPTQQRNVLCHLQFVIIKANSFTSQNSNQPSAGDELNATNLAAKHWNLREPRVICEARVICEPRVIREARVILSMIDENNYRKTIDEATLQSMQSIATDLVEATSTAGQHSVRLE